MTDARNGLDALVTSVSVLVQPNTKFAHMAWRVHSGCGRSASASA
jgi:hypothetical protein